MACQLKEKDEEINRFEADVISFIFQACEATKIKEEIESQLAKKCEYC